MITTLVILYCIIGAIFTWGITKEWRNDTSNELSEFSPEFVYACIVAASMIWPVLVIIAIFKTFKENK